MIAIGGLDVGTTGCKLSAYTAEGEFLGSAYREYNASRKDGYHELDAEEIFRSVCEVLSEVGRQFELTAIGITSLGETFAALDENDRVVHPAMLYTDVRGGEECRALCDALGEERIISITGMKPHSMYSLPKLMWIKNHRPEIYAKIRRVLLMGDFVAYMLTGNAAITYSLASRTMAFDIRKNEFSEEILSAAGVDKALFSTPVDPFHTVGTVKPALAKELGIRDGIRIIAGAHDQVAATVGAGVFSEGNAMDGTGTVECVVPVFRGIPENPSLYNDGFAVVPFVTEGTYVCYAVSYTGGAGIKWYRDNFSVEKSYAKMDAAVREEPTGILIMPHFLGGGTPFMDSTSSAAIIGMKLEHTNADFYKAMMEGVTYEMMLNLEHLERVGIRPEKLYATGGGAMSDVWLGIKADVLNRPVVSLDAKEAGGCGLCMIVGVAIGLYGSLEEAREKFVKERCTHYPDPKRHAVYRKYYEAYKKIYSAVRPITAELEGEVL